MGHQHGSKLLQLVPSDNSIEVHLLQNTVGGQLLTALVLKESGQHTGTLLACNTYRYFSFSHFVLSFYNVFESIVINTGVLVYLLKPVWCSSERVSVPPDVQSHGRLTYTTAHCIVVQLQ